ncbi:MAG: cation diffusion facilitator family transporter [Motiliproteus sp.]|jgi:cation diffusion facilitator family transporter
MPTDKHDHSHSHSHSPLDFDLPDDKRKYAIRVTWIGAVLDGILGIAKILIGLVYSSHALVADGIHSLSDLLTDFMVVAIVNFSHAEPDAEHPYGHERFETLGTVALGFILVAVAGAMAFESIMTLFSDSENHLPGWPTLVVALISIISKEWIFRYTLAAGKKLQSDLLIANAWHSRTDAYSSIVVFVGIGGAMLGVPWLDNMAAVGVAIFVAKIGWDLSWKSLQELVDTALPQEELDALTEEVLSVEGVVAVHSFKSRQMGAKSLLEMHLQVSPYISASEGHYIGDTAVIALLKKFSSIGHIIFHIDTEDDDESLLCQLLPLRSAVKLAVDDALQDLAPELQRSRINLHYLGGKIEIDLFIEAADEDVLFENTQDHHVLTEQLNLQLRSNSWFQKLTLWSAI